MRRAALGCVIVLAVAAGVVLRSGPARDAARDVAAPLGIVDDPPFAISLGGPLWRDRTILGEEGTRDIAAVTGDERLAVSVRRLDDRPLATVELRLEGRRISSLENRCRTCRVVRWFPLVPLAGLSEGDHRVELIARDERAGSRASDASSHMAVSSLDVRTAASVPRVVAREPARRGATRPTGTGVAPAVLRLLDRERRHSLRLLLGGSRLRVLHSGSVVDGRRRVGVTLLLEVDPPRRNIAAVLPAYVTGPDGRAHRGSVVARVAVLRDLLVDIDTRAAVAVIALTTAVCLRVRATRGGALPGLSTPAET